MLAISWDICTVNHIIIFCCALILLSKDIPGLVSSNSISKSVSLGIGEFKKAFALSHHLSNITLESIPISLSATFHPSKSIEAIIA